MDLKVYALLNAKIKELTGGGGLTQEEVEKIVTNEVAKIVAGAPADFDTLKEMSDWISSHENSAAEMNSAIQTNTNDISTLNTNKVDKVEGKSLISDTEIERLANVDNYDDSGVRADIETNETNISTLKKHMVGELTDSDFHEDSTVAMTKTVPTGISNYAAISKIGGKTQKVVQLISDRKTWTNGSTVDSKTFVMPVIYSRASTSSTTNIEQLDASSTSATGLYQRRFKATQNANAIYIKHNGTSKDIPIANNEASIVANHSYIFSCNIVANNPSAANGLSMTNIMLFDITAMGLSESITFAEFNQVFSSYVSYGSYLWNAPVESVVSVGKNRIVKSYYNTILGSDGRLSADTHYKCFAVECVAGQKYNITADATVYAFYETLPIVGTTFSYNQSRVISGSLIGITAPITGYLVFRTQSPYKYPACTLGDVPAITAADYIEPHKTTLLVPEAIKNLPDYGCAVSDTIYNWVDFENGVYHHVVGSVDLESLTFYKSASYYGGFTAQITNKKAGFNIICGRYSSYGSSWYWVNLDSIPDKSVGGNNESKYGKDVYFKDTSFGDSTAEQFKAAMSGVKLVYELATEELIDISDILHPIRCETGGTITFNNEHSLEVPNTVVYKKEVSLS